MCKSKECQHGKESPIKDWKHRCQFGPDGKKLRNGTVIVGWNDMATTHKALADECLDDATRYQAGTHKRLNWKCSVCDYEWPAKGSRRVRGSGCPCCSNNVAVTGKNDMATTHPELAKECLDDSTKYVAGTQEMLNWECSTCGHKWKATGASRTSMNSGCPCCSNKVVVPGKNDMGTTHPHLAKECLNDSTKYVAGTNVMLDWECSTCGYKWQSTGSDRVKGKGCSSCNPGGHDQTKESFVYLIYRPGQIQYGIMNTWTDRLKRHAKKGWELLDKIEVTGRKARSLETKIKQTLRFKGVPTGSKAFREKFDGSTESFQEVDLYVRSIRGLCRKLGVNLEAFLAS